jgi:carbamoyltransferase
MIILGLSCYYHDSAAALLVDGTLVAAAQEERFSRVKHDSGFPARAIRFCLGAAGLELGDIDHVAFYEKPFLKVARSLKVCMETFPRSLRIAPGVFRRLIDRQMGLRKELSSRLGLSPERIHFVEHHLSHAASAFYCSPFEEAALLTVDGVGEWSTATIGHGNPAPAGADASRLTIDHEIRFPHSLGMLYSAFTQFLGFQVNEGEYRVMGLAPYGRPLHMDKVEKVVSVGGDGSLRLNMEYFAFLRSHQYTYSDRFVKLFGRPNRTIEGDIAPYYADVAASIQAKTEEILLKMAAEAHRVTGSANLCLAGGVALNSVANGRISREGPFERVFIQPAAGDSGGALGAALYVEHEVLGRPRRYVMDHAYLGQSYTDGEVADALSQAGVDFETAGDDADLAQGVAEMLADGQVIGWMQDRFEWGPRALGARSILADPRRSAMKDVINAKVKFREPFRPFAPAILEHRAAEFFDFDPGRDAYPSRFMLTVHPFRDGKGPLVEAVNHVGTGRLQSVGPAATPRYRQLIAAFSQVTGVPLVLNTSFNLRGEPIVNSPLDALSTFARSGIDALVIGPHLVRKSTRRHRGPANTARPSSAHAPKAVKPWKTELYTSAPQVRDYHEQSLHPTPYLGFVQQPDYRSATVNTDASGFRFSQDDEGVVHSGNWLDRPRRGLLLGGSAAYGVGACDDGKTIASLLSRRLGCSFLNAGIRSGNSTQEVISALPFVAQADRVVVYTGNNTLLACLQSLGRFDTFAPLFQEETLARMACLSLRSYRQMFRRSALPKELADGELTDLAAGPSPTADEAARQALRIQTRDIVLLRRLCQTTTELAVVIQPFALTAKTDLTDEEEHLFDLLFRSKRESYALNKERMTDLWPPYVQKLADACRDQGIHVIDANRCSFQGWCFIDPVHMTDHGYATVADYIEENLR